MTATPTNVRTARNLAALAPHYITPASTVGYSIRVEAGGGRARAHRTNTLVPVAGVHPTEEATLAAIDELELPDGALIFVDRIETHLALVR